MATDIFHGIDAYLYDIDIAPTVFTEKEARAEYARLAKIANRRLASIKGSADFGTSAKASRAFFAPSTKNMKSDRQVYAALQQVARFNAQKTSTLTGLRKAQKAQLETMRERGYTWLNKGNIQEFGRFWQEVKKHAEYKSYSSERIADLFRQSKRKRIDSKDLAKNFEFWLQHENELDTMKRSNETINSKDAKERLGIS